MFHMGSVLQITLRWFKVLKYARTLNHQTDRPVGYRLVGGTKIDDTAHIYYESWANRDMPLFRGRPLHYVDTSRTSIYGDKLHADWTFHS